MKITRRQLRKLILKEFYEPVDDGGGDPCENYLKAVRHHVVGSNLAFRFQPNVIEKLRPIGLAVYNTIYKSSLAPGMLEQYFLEEIFDQDGGMDIMQQTLEEQLGSILNASMMSDEFSNVFEMFMGRPMENLFDRVFSMPYECSPEVVKKYAISPDDIVKLIILEAFQRGDDPIVGEPRARKDAPVDLIESKFIVF
jgi:hypothetical protein